MASDARRSKKRRSPSSASDGDGSSDQDEYVPLNKLPAFGARLRDHQIKFVRANPSGDEHGSRTTGGGSSSRGNRVADAYLNLVLDRKDNSHGAPTSSRAPVSSPKDNDLDANIDSHQQEAEIPLHVPYDPPPPTFDRQSKYFKYLESQGWDPDERRGLGATGNEGRLYPVKLSSKRTNAGLGLETEARRMRDERAQSRDEVQVQPVKQTGLLNAKQMRDFVRTQNDRAASLDFDFRGR